MIRQKEVYLVDFAKKYNSEFGKVRPAVIMQNNFLNRSLDDKKYQSVLVVPLSSTNIDDGHRVVIKKRDNLKENSECVANWICTMDISRVFTEKGLLTTLSDNEFEDLKRKVCSLI